MPPRVHDPALGLHISGSRMRSFQSEDGCKRAWAFQYIGGIVPPPSPGQKGGTALHWVGENYLGKGIPPSLAPLPPAANEDRELVQLHEKAKPIFAAGVTYLPTPNRPTLLVEHPAEAALDCGGTFTGTMDFFDLEGERSGGVPEVGDHKSTKQTKWIKTIAQLMRDPQALGYGYLAMLRTNADRIAFRWVYYRTTGAPFAKPVTFQLDRAYLEKGWERINTVGAEMLDLWKSKADPLSVPPTGYAKGVCEKFRGCYFKGICHGKDGKPMGASDGSSIFQQLKAKQGNHGSPPAATPPAATPQEDPDDLFGGADSVPVNPPLSGAAAALAQAAQAQKASPALPVQLPVAPPAQAAAPMPPAAEALASAAKKGRKPKAEANPIQASIAAARAAGVTAEQVQAAADRLEAHWHPARELAVFVDCIPLKGFAGVPRSLVDVFGSALKKAAELRGVANWRLIQYGEGDGVLAACVADQIEAERPTGVILVDSGTKEGRALLGVLEQYADVFIRKLG